VGPVDFSATPVDASLEFGDGKRPGLHSEFVLPLDLSPYARPHGSPRTARRSMRTRRARR
jgi:hypothetical protein